MKKLLIIFFFVYNAFTSYGQNFLDSIKTHKALLEIEKNDTNRLSLLLALSDDYLRNNYDSGLYYALQGLSHARKIDYKLGEAYALCSYEFGLRETGKLAEALNIQLQALAIARNFNDPVLEAGLLNSIGNSYLELGDSQNALRYYKQSYSGFMQIRPEHWHLDENGNRRPRNYITSVSILYWQLNELSNIGNAFEKLNLTDSALRYEHDLYANKEFPYDLKPELLGRLGNVYMKLGKSEQALSFYWIGIELSMPIQSISDRAIIYMQVAKVYQKLERKDSSLYYAQKAYNTAKAISLNKIVLAASRFLGDEYSRNGKPDSAVFYKDVAMEANDMLFGPEKFRHIQIVLSEEQRRQQLLAEQQERLNFRYQVAGALSVFVFLTILMAVVLKNNKRQKKVNRILRAQKEELTRQRDEIENTLTDLKRTQVQLVQSEKMASLGGLTAGIAHEIQNPLNFVNNFSEVSRELLDELQTAIRNGNSDEALSLSGEIDSNLKKVVHHGKRADSIVKNMLQHSRSGSGEKSIVDINALLDEYLRLSYHGLRAKDKNFGCIIETHFDKHAGNAEIIRHEIGRVLLNLFNNAFYSMQQKKKLLGKEYEPLITVSTTRSDNGISISVKDNGMGIPQSVVDKIYQPFFTTKPTGEGTGLGLSLSYEIITKGHGGELTVESKENEAATFTIVVPVSKS